MASKGVHRVPTAPTAEAEPAHIDDTDDELPSVDGPSRMSLSQVSQCSTLLTIDSGRASSHSTLQSPEKSKGYLRSRKMVVCRISLLDGQTFEPKGIDKGATGQVVFDKVTHHLDLIETDYFGLTFRDKTGKKHWLDNTKKITNQVKGGTWVFEFQVKFYPPDPQSLKEDLTRYQLCLQVRVDLFNGRLLCSFVTYALLGSYTVQAELGDYDPMEYGGSIDYLKDFDFAPNQNLELLEKIAELHKYHKGQTPEEAESNFLENAKRLALYGVDLHDVKDKDNKPLVLGVCASGILVYKDRLRIDRFVWPKILKLEYKRNMFLVQVRPGQLDPKERTVAFGLDNHKLAKRLWKICVEHHAFFRLKDAEGADQGTLFPRFNTKFRYSGRTQAQAKKAAESHNRQEPHIARTAERRSIAKARPLDMDEMEMKQRHPDEKDMYDKKKGDPNAMAGMYAGDQNNLDKDGKQKRAPGDESEDRRDKQAREGEKIEGEPGYAGDTAGLGAKGKKEDEKKRKKDEEKRKKDEEKEKLKQDFFRLLNDTPGIDRRSKLNDVKHKIDKDPRYKAVGSNSQREDWFNEYVKNLALKEDFMNLLKERPEIDRFSLWNDVKPNIESDPRYQAVPSDALREQWFDEYVKDLENKLKSDFMQLLNDTPDINRHSKWNDVKPRIQRDPRYQAVGSSPLREDWFNEYVHNIGLKDDFMQLLKDTPDITRHSQWKDVRPKIEKDPRYQAVPSNARKERWFNEYLKRLEDKMKSDYMQLLAETPDINRHSKWGEVKHKIDSDPRYKAVDSNAQREDWFKEYVKGIGLKEDFMQLLADTPDIDRHSKWEEVKPMIQSDPWYIAVDSNSRRERWFNEYKKSLDDQEKKAAEDAKRYETDLDVILMGKGAITKDLEDGAKKKGKGEDKDSKHGKKGEKGDSFREKKGGLFGKFGKKSPTKKEKDGDFPPPPSPLDEQDKRAGMMWALPGMEELKERQQAASQGGPAPGAFGLSPGDYKSIDRKMQFMPVVPPTVETRHHDGFGRMPFFQPAGDDSSLGRKGPPPVAKKPKAPGGYDSEEDRLLRRSGEPPTVKTESFKYTPNLDEPPMSTSNIPIVETKTHTVTYERDGVPFETEDSILISAHSYTTKSQTIDTTTYKTERNGVIETRVERKVTVTSDDTDDIDHDALLRAAIEEVTRMNPDLSVERIECIKQIEGEK